MMVTREVRWMPLTIAVAMVLAALTGASAAVGEAPAVGASVAYVANEGFLIEHGEHRVLVDGLFEDHTIAYADVPSRATLAAMQAGAPPFAGIDLMLVTHAHRDHFAPGPVAGFLRANPGAHLVCTPQALAKLRASDPALDDMAARIHAPALATGEAATVDTGLTPGLQVLAIRLRHASFVAPDPQTGESRDIHAGIEDNAYLVTLGERRLLHVGDAQIDQNLSILRAHLPAGRRIDTLFLASWDTSPETLAFVNDELDVGRIVLMHLPAGREAKKARAAELEGRLPNAVVLVDQVGVED